MKDAKIEISATKQNSDLVIVVYNSGPALPRDWKIADKNGIGLQNINRRLQTLFPEESNLSLINNLNGVEARLTIPFSTKG